MVSTELSTQACTVHAYSHAHVWNRLTTWVSPQSVSDKYKALFTHTVVISGWRDRFCMKFAASVYMRHIRDEREAVCDLLHWSRSLCCLQSHRYSMHQVASYLHKVHHFSISLMDAFTSSHQRSHAAGHLQLSLKMNDRHAIHFVSASRCMCERSIAINNLTQF